MQLASGPVLDEGDETIVRHLFFDLPEEGYRYQALSDSEPVELMVRAGAATSSDPDEIDEPIVNPPATYFSECYSVMNVSTDYFQWLDCVATDDLNMLSTLQAKVADTTAPVL